MLGRVKLKVDDKIKDETSLSKNQMRKPMKSNSKYSISRMNLSIMT